MRRNCKKCDKLRSVAKHPKGIASFANTIKVYKQIYWQCCNGLAHLLADDEMTNTLLPCSVGCADVRIIDDRFILKLKKKQSKSKCHDEGNGSCCGKPKVAIALLCVLA